MDSSRRSRIDGRKLGAKEGRAPSRKVSHDDFPGSRIGGGRARKAVNKVSQVETRTSRYYGKPTAVTDIVAGFIGETHEISHGILLADIADVD